MYKIEKNYNRLQKGGYTFFISPDQISSLKGKLGKIKYNIFRPTKDSEKIIFYKDKFPEVSLYEIETNNSLRHQEILGSLFALNISEEMYGDIIIDNGHYYIFILDMIEDYLISSFNKVGRYNINLKKHELSKLKNYERSYETIELIVTSLRIDTIIPRLIHTNRDSIKDKVKDRDIYLNHELLKKVDYKLKDGDIFSIRKFGKYKFIGISNTTKKDNLVVRINKYS